eukprot:759550-Hanusia_phi.AAC.7
MQAFFLRREWGQARQHWTLLRRFQCHRSFHAIAPRLHLHVRNLSFPNDRRLLSTVTEGNGKDYTKGRYLFWPWMLAVASGSLTVYVVNSIEDENLYKRIVKELHSASGLKSLRALFVFAGRRPDDVREKLARHGCVEALVSLQLRTTSDMQDYASKLESLHALSISSGQMEKYRDQFMAAFSSRETCCQMLAVVMDSDRGREKFFNSESFMDVISSLITDQHGYDWAALASEYRQNKIEGKPVSSPSLLAHKQTFGSLSADDELTVSKDAAEQESNTKPREWTPSEAMLIASIATDPRGQELLCKSQGIRNSMLDILTREDGVPRTRQGIIEYQNNNIRKLAIIRAIGGIAKNRGEEATNFLNSPELIQTLIDLYHRKQNSDPLAARLIGCDCEMSECSLNQHAAVDVAREMANAIPKQVALTCFYENAFWAGLCGSLWGTLRHYRYPVNSLCSTAIKSLYRHMRQKTVIPLPGTLQRAAQASIPAGGEQDHICSRVQVYLVRELFKEESTFDGLTRQMFRCDWHRKLDRTLQLWRLCIIIFGNKAIPAEQVL